MILFKRKVLQHQRGNNLPYRFRSTLSKSTFKLSSAYMDESRTYSKVDGGALFITGNDIVVNDTTFDSCTATNNGGAVYIIGNNTHLYNADFNNCAARDGGAICSG